MLNVLDLFSGAGGFAVGIHKNTFFKIKVAIEFDKTISNTYKKFFSDTTVINNDIRKINIENIFNIIPKVDIIVGGPPCQGFSIAGKRKENDERNSLPYEYFRYVSFFKPTFFVMENVKGITSFNDGKMFKQLIEDFNSIGYNTFFEIINMYDYEIPQIRERLILVGVNRDFSTEPFLFPCKTDKKTNIGDVIHDIIKTGRFEDVGIHNHEDDSNINKYIYNKLLPGEFLCDMRNGAMHKHSWDIALKGKCSEEEIIILETILKNRRHKKYGIKDGNPLSERDIQELVDFDISYHLEKLISKGYIEKIENKFDLKDRKINLGLRRFSKEEPLNTITTINTAYCHYSEPRNFTVRELARIQTFPDNFIFLGEKQKQMKQVGNAVPPLFSYKLFLKIQEYYLKNK